MSSIYDMEDDDTDVSQRCGLATLKFPDDFAEFQARADSGGSTYGMLKRHAFAQQSLRVVPPSDPEVDVVVPQRRANSLIPPVNSSPETEASSDAGTATDQKMIIAEQSPQQRRCHRHHHYPHSDQEVSDKRYQQCHKSDRDIRDDKHKGDRKSRHRHQHKQRRHYHNDNEQNRQLSEPHTVKMDTLQVFKAFTC